jgi:hypothetical protein
MHLRPWWFFVGLDSVKVVSFRMKGDNSIKIENTESRPISILSILRLFWVVWFGCKPRTSFNYWKLLLLIHCLPTLVHLVTILINYSYYAVNCY